MLYVLVKTFVKKERYGLLSVKTSMYFCSFEQSCNWSPDIHEQINYWSDNSVYLQTVLRDIKMSAKLLERRNCKIIPKTEQFLLKSPAVLSES